MLSTIFSGMDDLIVILIAVVVLFGGTQLPKLARNTGEALREFRKSHSEAEATSAAVTTPAPASSPAPVAAVALPTATVVSSDSVTMSRTELDALLADHAAQSPAEGSQAGA